MGDSRIAKGSPRCEGEPPRVPKGLDGAWGGSIPDFSGNVRAVWGPGRLQLSPRPWGTDGGLAEAYCTANGPALGGLVVAPSPLGGGSGEGAAGACRGCPGGRVGMACRPAPQILTHMGR
ncbi:hypothetical protein DORI_43 [Mycobacterium phage Dori]|uniref:hypothetical protein n=1 Tax=Mycobacterium phage Dori TaxID=1089121 RepID=UPI000232F502|nr:hypothetical protein DORI_43 [Mycobacterium phage Dori]AER47745.1 hypothetical protein DORI_43 [Mycobacterium phage Dori]